MSYQISHLRAMERLLPQDETPCGTLADLTAGLRSELWAASQDESRFVATLRLVELLRALHVAQEAAATARLKEMGGRREVEGVSALGKSAPAALAALSESALSSTEKGGLKLALLAYWLRPAKSIRRCSLLTAVCNWSNRAGGCSSFSPTACSAIRATVMCASTSWARKTRRRASSTAARLSSKPSSACLPTHSNSRAQARIPASSICKSAKARDDDPEKFQDHPQTDLFMAVADTLGYLVKNNVEDYSAGVPNDLAAIVGNFVRGE